MPEHDGNDPVDPTDPFNELEPIDLTALFGDELDDEPDDGDVERDDAVGEADAADALLMAQLFAADLADEPASRFSVADLVAAARPAAGSGSGATAAARTPERSVADPAARRARDAKVDELARQRRRRSWMSRGLLAAAAVAVLVIGATAALNSQGGSDTASSLPAAGTGYSANSGAVAAGSATAGAMAPESDAGSSSAPAKAPAAPSSAGSYATAMSPMESTGGGSASAPDQGGTGSRSSAGSASESSGTSSASGSASSASAPIGRCQVPRLSTAAVAAVMGVPGRSSSLQLDAAVDSVGDCRDQVLAGQVFTTTDGSQLTVLLARDPDVELSAGGSTSSNGAAVRSAELRSGGVRVLVTTPAGSSVTDRQLTQVATAVLGARR
ncbi:hypothetical protein ABLG96_19135 [Nakamurella sp. A5-74]|uniref:Uncharacterized protein n=1 Tax=Nakamurella sp. A5-74 TaxID=3158264 RepID=A0AAU8DMS4_9ACTN